MKHLPSLPLIFRPRVFLTEKQNKHNVSTMLKMMKWENKTLFRNKSSEMFLNLLYFWNMTPQIKNS